MAEQKSTSIVLAILKTGLLAGTLDILCALSQFLAKTGKNPEAVLIFIASGVFGESAFSGGIIMAVAGLAFHYVIALIWTVLFFILYTKIPFLSKNTFVSGIVYGILIWVIMTLMVLPLSNTPHIPFNLHQAVIGLSFIILAVGLPIAVMARNFFSSKCTD